MSITTNTKYETKESKDITLVVLALDTTTWEEIFERKYDMPVTEAFLKHWEYKKHNLQSHTEWFRTKIALNHAQESQGIINKWTICLVDYGMNIGTEINGIRPSIVFKSAHYKYGEDTIVIPITSYEDESWVKSVDVLDIVIEPGDANGLRKRSIIKIRQMRVVSKKRIRKNKWNIKILGKLSDKEKQREIHLAVVRMLGLDVALNKNWE